jgi:hypothetical protein
MTREEWIEFDRIKYTPDVQLAMRARCEEQRHEWENCATIMFEFYTACKWCGERQ